MDKSIKSPIFIVEDDEDEREIFTQVWAELNFENPLQFFKSGDEILNYLNNIDTVPFLIISNVNLPKMDGFELKKHMQEHKILKYKTIPFVFFSTIGSNEQIKKAFDLGTGGFFIKESNFEALKETLNDIVHYWSKSKVPE